MVLSFGASRNGAEVRRAIAEQGEWARLHQADLPLHKGGAHFVTLSAVAELIIIQQMKRNSQIVFEPDDAQFTMPLEQIRLSTDVDTVNVETNSTEGGARYGSTSPQVQFDALKKGIEARNRHGLPHEIEWGQYLSSYALAKYAIHHPDLRLGQPLGSLNITLLFGFSPKLPFPHTYRDFKRIVDAAKRLQYDPSTGEKLLDITVTVGASVLPKYMAEHYLPLDIADGALVQPIERIAAYAAQPDSGVDVVRAGMEDSPCVIGPGGLAPTTNRELVRLAARRVEKYGAELVLSPHQAAHTLRTPRPAAPHAARNIPASLSRA
jgi:hypothetical protein